MKAGFLHVSHELLHDMMQLPPGVDIRGVEFVSPTECRMLLVGEGLHEVAVDREAKQVRGIVHKEQLRWEFEPV